MDWLRSQPVVMQAFLAGLFTWSCTIVGSAIVFFFKQVSRKLLDIMMGFAAGAMIFVVVEELIPDSQTNGNTDVATLGLMVGFVLMMVLDVALG
ncbi:ZIP zinc transporter family protein [Streptococcus cristatus ATCC 51100]|uniref:ZIP zinc transporter family protein n=1 Tax=Streptococcus cristatus ATCC 51100 TaxID=889201 RepID=A0AAV3ECY3_STRCR|nr:zinc transporter [Streptococcus cristatus]EGU66193.1 ZIP zinc transporter family protein [Streptococcus cristatus ATCC 51100]KJQ57186.1 ZIP zinc transporter family protein [Streptococcus cristatus]SQG32143.1 GufA-like protein [Streptococcus cristatus ATCC 51100]